MTTWTTRAATRRARTGPPARRRAAGVVGLACAVSAVALLAAACGGGGGDSQPQQGTEEFGLTSKQIVTKAEAVENHIADCMHNAGFDYVANDWESINKAMNADKSAPGLSEAEYLHTYGFGISTQYEKPIVNLGLGPDNADTLKALPASQQAAYLRTLLGKHSDQVFANALEAEDFSRTGGCTKKAIEKEFTAKEMSSSYINPADQKVDQDPRVKDALKKYQACMRKKGFDYTTPDEAEPDIQQQFDKITQGEDPRSLEGAQLAQLKELQATEIRVAEASSTCEAKYVEPVREKVQEEIFGRQVK
jgi:hypothetical protein